MSSWLAPARRAHTRVMLIVLAVSALLGVAGGEIPMSWQIGLIAFGVAILGLPHGAYDAPLARRWLEPRLGPGWWRPFLLAYLGLAGFVVAGFALLPVAMLVAFLAVSAYHFGEEDSKGGRWPTALARGAVPVLAPMSFWPEEVAQLFAWIVPGGIAFSPSVVRAMLFIAVLVVAFDFVVRRDGWAALEVGLLIAVAATLPPLVAFGLYFLGLHSPRHTLDLAAEISPNDRRHGIVGFIREAAPATGATILLAGLGYFFLRDAVSPGPALVRVVFVGLAALTFPHMALAALRARDGGQSVGLSKRNWSRVRTRTMAKRT